MPLLQKLLHRSNENNTGVNPLAEIFSEIPSLPTERLLLRRLTPDDADDMYDYSRRDTVTRYLLWDPHPDRDATAGYLRMVCRKYASGEYYDWGIECTADHRMIGTCGFVSIDIDNGCGEVGYVLHPQYWGMGFATEALDAVLGFGFDVLHLHRIEARYLIGNERSRRVMERCGMQFEGIRRDGILQRGVFRDVGGCAVLHDEYQIGRVLRRAEKNAAVVIPSEGIPRAD